MKYDVNSVLLEKRIRFIPILMTLTMLWGISCSDDASFPDIETDATIEDAAFVPEDWTIATHSKEADPDFSEVFSDTEVKRLDIVITPEHWQEMRDDMTRLYGSFGVFSGGPGGGSFSDENPVFIPAEIYYNGRQWYKVGVRFKGNSSLASSWKRGILKLSFKLDFDEYEDDFPQIDNQRFYGFKKLSLKNNFDDQSFLREKVAADVFKAAGLAVSHTAFYTVYVDYGEGPVYFGLYTMVEEVDDTVIDTQFSSDDGNLYKPEEYGATFEAGTFNEGGFEKKTNEDEGDWSDIQSLFAALHDDTRLTDPETWRTRLESIFDTETFLNYLAVNTVIQNWDTYGIMPHNYYLYHKPDNGQLTWIPWDNNEALQNGKMGGALHLDFSNLESGAWPLIEYLYEDDNYREIYHSYLRKTIEGAFAPGKISSLYDRYASLVEPMATSEETGYSFLNSSDEFYEAIEFLKQHVVNRNSVVENYLD